MDLAFCRWCRILNGCISLQKYWWPILNQAGYSTTNRLGFQSRLSRVDHCPHCQHHLGMISNLVTHTCTCTVYTSTVHVYRYLSNLDFWPSTMIASSIGLLLCPLLVLKLTRTGMDLLLHTWYAQHSATILYNLHISSQNGTWQICAVFWIDYTSLHQGNVWLRNHSSHLQYIPLVLKVNPV